MPPILKRVAKGSKVSTDKWRAYEGLSMYGYDHEAVDHSRKEYVRGDCHTNSLENFWSQLKRSIRGTHIHVSPKHLQKYLGEFEFRFNRRKVPNRMFSDLLLGFCSSR